MVFTAIQDYLFSYGDLTYYHCLLTLILCYVVYALFFATEVKNHGMKPIFEDVERPFDRNEIDGRYPKGWYIICSSSELPMNGVKAYSLCDQEFVAFRGWSGAVHVLSAYCPHLGANIGIGGTVVSESGDDCIQCPFHGWVYRGDDGDCVHIPNLEKKELKGLNARVKHWVCHENNGLVYHWYHHSDGVPEPDFYPDVMSQTYQMELRQCRSFSVEVQNCQQNINEDVVDFEHNWHVHQIKGWLAKHLQIKFIQGPAQTPDHPDDPYRKYKVASSSQLILWDKYKLLELSILQRMTGPSFSEILFQVYLPFAPKVVAVYSTLPTGAGKTQWSVRIFTGTFICARIFANLIGMSLEEHLLKDCVIRDNQKTPEELEWEEGDEPIIEYREWFKQFYD